MIRSGFLSAEDRKLLIALARDGSAVGRVTRRANALVLLDGGMSCQEVARVLLFDGDTMRNWHALFEQGGVEGLIQHVMLEKCSRGKVRSHRLVGSLRSRGAGGHLQGRLLSATYQSSVGSHHP